MRLSPSSFVRLGPALAGPHLAALAALVLAATVYLPYRTLVPPSGDLMLIAWNPGQQLLRQGTVNPGYPYPLWTPVLLLPIVAWPAPVAAALWFGCNLVLLALSAVLLLDVGGWPRRAPAIVMLSLLIGLYDPVFTSFWLGQIVFFSLAVALALMRALRQGRWALAGALLGASCVKPQVLALAVLAAFVVALHERRWALFAGFGAVLAGLVALALPFAASARQLIGAGAGEHLVTYLARTSTIWGLSLRLLPGWLFIPAVASGGLLLWLAVTWLRAIRASTWRQKLTYLTSATLIVNTAALPYSWPYNNALLVLPLCYGLGLAMRLRGAERVLWAVLLLGLAFPCTQLVYATLTRPYRSEVFQIIPALLLLPLLVALEHRSAKRESAERRAA